MDLKVVLVGKESAGVQVLRALVRSPHRIIGVMSSDNDSGIGSLRDAAEELGYPTWPAQLVKDPFFADRLRSEQVDILLNVHSLFIVHPEVVEAPRIGSFNLHPGPLPRYAGLNAMSWALYRGERTHGVTLHKMVPEIDAGPIVYQTVFEIEESDAALSLTSKCVKAGLPLILRLLETASVDPSAVPLVPQDRTKREYFGREIPEGGRLTWSRPAREILNFVRACDYFPFRSPWGHPRTGMNGQECAIVKASLTGRSCDCLPGTIGERLGSSLQVASADEWVLVSKIMHQGRYLNPVEVFQPETRLKDGG